MWPWPRRIAHRGGGALAPENTLAAIRAGMAHGYRAVEFDVMLTADDVPVLMHDPDFGRTIAGSGRVATTNFADLARRDAGVWFAERFRGEPVPRFDDVVAFCRLHDVWMNIEIKPSAGAEARTGRIVAEMTGAAFGSPDERLPLFSSFSVAALEAARAAAPHVPRGLLVGRPPADAIDSAIGLGCVSVHVAHRWLDRDTIDAFHRAGLAVMAYTVNDPARAALLDVEGIDAICTDRIDLIHPGA
jgi:glycerophosphoryl diester phosphodiesterase